MFKKGDKVKLNPNSRYFNHDKCQLPPGVVGRVREDQKVGYPWIYVEWVGGNNAYHKEDLIKVTTFKGNK